MYKKILILTIGLAFIMASAAMAIEFKKAEIPGPVGPPESSRDACTMWKWNSGLYTYGGLAPGNQIVTFYDPAVECTGIPTYPFEIISLSFTLGMGAPWPVQVDFVVYDMLDPSDFCAGPGAELCRETFSLDQASFEYPAMGTLTLTNPCCVNGPVYIGIEYSAGQPVGLPSPYWDDGLTYPPVQCDHWFFDGVWYEMVAWQGGFIGGSVFTVNGETNSANCPGDEWPNHKMHFPQLPDPTGWDVNATAPLSLADDWQCSETGYVKDLHFWGSWRSDDVGVINGFTLTIHSNDPQGPGGYSIPDVPLWGPVEIVDFVITPVDPPSLQGWYDPQSGEVVPDEHTQYFRYDIILPQGLWFEQTINEIYWLRITANVQDPAVTFWGWKNSQDHFMDDAVWKIPGGEWVELYEPSIPPPPPIVNAFNIVIDPNGMFAGGFGEDSYPGGENGWYFYPNTNWWNVWFFDHPFDPTRMKEFFTVANIMPMIPGMPSMVEVAINWATPDWPPGGPPPIPPLDPVQEETSIGRETFYLFEGILEPGGPPVEFSFVIPNYNPEWVSIDVRGYNFIIDGVIEHTCLPQGGGEEQSLDLSFVITGEPEGGDIPTLNEWGLIILALLLLAAGTIAVIRRRRTADAREM